MSSIAVKAAAAHSTRVGNSNRNCIGGKFIKRAEKIFSRAAFKLIASGQNASF
jgi:hypothetical protein